MLTTCLREIYRRYPNQWVLIECRKVNTDLRVVEGKVVAHADNRDAIYKRLLDFRDKDIAIEYTGPFPDNVAIVF
jgi:hypothetical protein